jgi:hypothetical protein
MMCGKIFSPGSDKQGPIGKDGNIVLFVRLSDRAEEPKKQRRERMRRYVSRRTRKLRVTVNPCFGEMDDKSFRILTSFESIRQTADGMRVPLAIDFPGYLSSRTPQLGALIQGCVGDDKMVFVIQVRHDQQ